MRIKNKGLILALITFCIISAAQSDADVIKLKKGRSIEGAIISETKDTVTVDIGIGEATLNKSDIATIQRAVKSNAAIYYLRAIGSANYGNYGMPKNKIDGLENKKFMLDEKELSGMLDNNKVCLEEMAKGLAIKDCDFYFEDKYNYTGRLQQKRNQKDVMYLHSLLLLKGRYHECRKEPDLAVDSYLDTLKFAAQVAQGPDPEFRTASIMIEKNAYPIIEEYVKSKSADPKLCKKIFAFLNEHERRHFSAVDFLKSCKEYFIAWFDSYNTDIIREMREDTKIDEKLKGKAVIFSGELAKQAKELADKYYGNLILAAKTDAEKDWKAAQDEYQQLASGANPQAMGDEVDIAMFVSKTLGDIKECANKDPKATAVTILSAALPYDETSITIYRENDKELKKLKFLAAQNMGAIE